MDRLEIREETVQEVILDGQDVTALAEFVKHRKLFDLLRDRGVFSTKSGSVTLHFDQEGTLRKIDSSVMTTWKLSTD